VKVARAIRRLARCGAALALVTAIATSCGPAQDAAPPRLVILYATCTLAKGFLSPYDRAVTWTPRIDAFARRGVVFRRHQTETGFSGIAFASIFTGAQATRHGVFSQPMRLGEEVLLITEAFADAGFEVWFWGDHAMASADLGYAQGVPPERRVSGAGGFRIPDPRRPHPEHETFLRADDPRFVRLLDGLRSDPRRRALVVTNFTVTHAPYSMAYLDALCRDDPGACPADHDRVDETAEFFWRHYVDLSWNFDATVRRLGLGDADVARIARVAELLYRANVHRLDGLFGEVVAAVDASGLRDASAIAFTADHGELLHREGAIFHWNHGFTLTPEELGVPWLLVAPGVPPSEFSGVTRSIDVFPTLAGLAGVPLADGAVEGVDLSPALRGESPAPELVAFSHTALAPQDLLRVSRARGGTRLDELHPDRDPDRIWVSLRDGDRVYKLTRKGGLELEHHAYDLSRDPTEQHNLYDSADAVQRERLEDLERYHSALRRRLEAAAPAPALPESESLERLRRLGYVE
jgi:arylsulfatase A-like enzyme